MYLTRTGLDGKYAAATTTKCHGNKFDKDYIYLSTVIDAERGIYKNKGLCVFTFNLETGEFGEAPEDVIAQ